MSSIAAGTTSGTALVSTGDTTGSLVLKTGSSATTALTIDTLQNVGIGTTPVTWSTQVEALQIGPHAAYYSNTVDTTTVVSNNLYVSAGGSNTYSNTGAVAQFYQVNGQHVWRSAASGTAGTTVALTQVLAVEKDRSLALQGATTQTGAGISFPATQVASSDANTLDDYEEGTWTPTFSPAGGSVTHSTRQGNYVKVGSMVLANFFIQISSASSPSGGLSITGFPFQTLGSSYGNPGAGLTNAGNWSTQTPERIQAGGANTTGFNLLYRTSITGSLDNSITLASSLQANTYVYGSVVYQTT
jgi:hypothetical protein